MAGLRESRGPLFAALAVVVSVAVLVAVAAVRRGHQSDEETVAQLLLTQPRGFVEGPREANGRLGLDEASRATAAASDAVREALEDNGFDAAEARVWTSEKGFLTDVVFALRDQAAAEAVVAAITTSLRGADKTAVEPFAEIRGASAYSYFVQLTDDPSYRICSGVAFPVGRWAHVLATCDDRSPDVQQLRERAVAQWRHARG